MLPFFIARRHLFSRKSHSVINLIAGVSVVAVAVPVMALVVILSFHNGLGDFIGKMYSEFDSQLRVTPREGQLFDGRRMQESIAALPEVEVVSATAEQNVLIAYSDRQWIASMRGVDSAYTHVVPIERRMVQGKYRLRHGELDEAVIGQGVAYALGVQTALPEPLQLYAIRPGSGSPSFLPTGLYHTARVRPAGIYALDEQTDSRYIFVPLEFAQRLAGAGGKVSSLEIRLKDGVPEEAGKRAVSAVAGPGFDVKTRFEQKETVYRMVAQEKWIIYLLLMFVVLIAALSLVGSVVMLAADKERDRGMLLAMGGTPQLLRRIFTWEGTLITVGGVTIGLLLGISFAVLQQRAGIIKMAGDAFLMDAYPVRIEPFDLLAVAGGVLLLGTAVSALTAAGLIKRK
ncbi:MAG: ABC transporter permease [Rikenellaceae bacterium]|nr:ABC transporter permease [Rikenellaceae bacterium]